MGCSMVARKLLRVYAQRYASRKHFRAPTKVEQPNQRDYKCRSSSSLFGASCSVCLDRDVDKNAGSLTGHHNKCQGVLSLDGLSASATARRVHVSLLIVCASCREMIWWVFPPRSLPFLSSYGHLNAFQTMLLRRKYV